MEMVKQKMKLNFTLIVYFFIMQKNRVKKENIPVYFYRQDFPVLLLHKHSVWNKIKHRFAVKGLV